MSGSMLGGLYVKFRQAVFAHKKLAVKIGNGHVNRQLSECKKC